MIRELFYYDETSPSGLRWKQDRFSGNNKLQAARDTQAGGLHGSGYYEVRVDGRLAQVHRVIYELFNGKIPEGRFVDHIDGNPANNTISNLRLVDARLNARNRKMEVRNTSGVTGVHPYKFPDGTIKGYVAGWREEPSGLRKSKSFSFKNHGEYAFEKACSYRLEKIKELNSKGAGYTERHGGPSLTITDPDKEKLNESKS